MAVGDPRDRQARADETGRHRQRTCSVVSRGSPRGSRPGFVGRPDRRHRWRRWHSRWWPSWHPPSRSGRRPAGSVAARCCWFISTGAAGRRLVVKVAATAAGPSSTTNEARSGAPEALMPALVPEARKPLGRRAARSSGGRLGGQRSQRLLTPGRAGVAAVRSASGRPKTRLKACTAWPAAPLTRLSSTETVVMRPVRSSSGRRRARSCMPSTCAVDGGVSITSTKYSSA